MGKTIKIAKRIKNGEIKTYGAVFFVRTCLLPAKSIALLIDCAI
jgi:hypothetical protein